MKPDTLDRTWIGLVALSGCSAIIAEVLGIGLDGRLTGAAILILALMKTRLILAHYLGLSAAASWRRGFNLSLALFCLLLLGLYILPAVIS